MNVDIGSALASVASPGISRVNLNRLDTKVAAAHERIEAGRANHEHGYEALNMPAQTDPAVVRETIEPVAGAEALITVGIGGSALGAKTITDALAPDLETAYLDNVDPAWVTGTLESLPLEETAINVVSKSGTTAETLANFLVVRDHFEEAGVDWTERTIVTTGQSGPLAELAESHDLPKLPVPDGVPGRFSALTPVGLVAAAIGGVDIDALIEGAKAEEETLGESLFDCPAYAYGAITYALDQRGAHMNAMMPYVEAIETFSEWYAQLWAESLGKDGLGQTPLRALGVTDQHSQLQLYRAGPRDKLVTFVHTEEIDDRAIPETDIADLAYLGGATLGELLTAEFEATEASLAVENRPSVRIELEAINAFELGGLLYGMEAACVLAGELYGVDAFDQPAVEWGKKAARGLLGGGDFEEADAVAEKTTLRIER